MLCDQATIALSEKKDTIVQMQSDYDQLVSQTYVRVGSRNLTNFAGYSMAARMTSGHASRSTAIAMMAGSELNVEFKSTKSLARYERLLGCCHKVRFKSWYAVGAKYILKFGRCQVVTPVLEWSRSSAGRQNHRLKYDI